MAAAIGAYVDRKERKIEQGKSHIYRDTTPRDSPIFNEQKDGNVVPTYRRKKGRLECFAETVSKGMDAVDTKSARISQCFNAWWSATAFGRAITSLVSQALGSNAAVIAGGTVMAAALPSVGFDTAKSAGAVKTAHAKLDADVALCNNFKGFKEFRRCYKAGTATPQDARRYLDVLKAAPLIPKTAFYMELPGRPRFELTRARFRTLRDEILQTLSITNSITSTVGQFAHVASIGTAVTPIGLSLGTVAAVCHVGQGVLEWKDNSTKEKFAEGLKSAAKVLEEDRDPLLRDFGAQLRKYASELAQLAHEDKFQGAVRALYGGLMSSLGIGGMAALGVGIGVGASAAPPVALALGVGGLVAAGLYYASVVRKEEYTKCYKEHQEEQQASDLNWVSQRGLEGLIDEIRDPTLPPTLSPSLHIRAMLKIAAGLMDDDARAGPSSGKGKGKGRRNARACKLMLQALGLDPESELCGAIVLASADLNDRRARIAFIESHLAKAILLDLVPESDLDSSRSDARAVSDILDATGLDGDPEWQLAELKANGFQLELLPLVYKQLALDSFDLATGTMDPGSKDLMRCVARLASTYAQAHPQDGCFAAVMQDIAARVKESEAHRAAASTSAFKTGSSAAPSAAPWPARR